MATKNKPSFKIGDQVTLRATVTIPDGDERTGADCVVVMLDGDGVPARLSVDKVGKTGRSERDERYFSRLVPGGFVGTLCEAE
jgi:hypothetical protein